MHASALDCARLLDDLHGLRSLVETERPSIEAERRLTASLFEALADAGLFRLWLPRSLGGPELSPLDFMDVVEAASRLDASVGWIVGNGSGASRFAGYLEEVAGRAFFSAPRSFVAAATGAVGKAIPAPGGYRVTGRWPYGSGIHGATGVAGLCAVPAADAAAARQIMCLAPADAAIVFDTWHVSGLRGTGSCDWALEEVFVPEAHTFALTDRSIVQPGVVYRLPAISTFAWSVSVVPLAIARACLDAFVDLARDRTRQGTSQPLRERETVQSEVGRADGRLRSARAFLVGAMVDLMEAVERREEDLVPYRSQLRLAAAHAAETALQIASAMEAAAGAAAIFEDGPLAGRLRDLRAAVQHVAMSPNNYVVAGRLRLGLDPGTTRI